MLDEYVWGDVRRISPEAPVPVVAVIRDTRTLGGAANVALNVASLGAGVDIAGLVGSDPAGREITRMLRIRGIGVSGLVVDPGRPTTVKTRVIAHQQQVVRVDREKIELPVDKARKALKTRVLATLDRADGVVFSDYRKGALSRDLVEEVAAAAKRRGVFVAVDPKQTDFAYYRGCTVITPNKAEAEAALGGRELTGDLEGGKSPPAEDRGERDSCDPGGGRDEPGRTRPPDVLPHTGAGTPGVRRDRRRGHRDRHPCDGDGGWCADSGCRPPRECGRGGRGGRGRNRAHNRG